MVHARRDLQSPYRQSRCTDPVTRWRHDVRIERRRRVVRADDVHERVRVRVGRQERNLREDLESLRRRSHVVALDDPELEGVVVAKPYE